MTDKERLDKINSVLNDPCNTDRDCYGQILTIMGDYEN